MHRHIGNDGSGRILRKLISLFEGIYLHYVVSVEGGLNDGARLAEAGLPGTDL